MSDLSQNQEILILRRGGLGDLLCSLPMIQVLHQKAPQAKKTILIEGPQADLAKYFSTFMQSKILASGNKYLSLLSEALHFRKQKIDLAICAKTSPMKLNNYFLLLLNAKKSLAYVDKNSWHGRRLLTCQEYFPELAQKRHQALKNLQLINPLQESIPEELFPKISKDLLKKTAKKQSKHALIFINLSYNRQTSHPGSLYLHCLNQMFKRKKFEILISCQKEQLEEAYLLHKMLHAPSRVFCGKNFDAFLGAIEESDICFVGDGGCMHLAAALDKKVLALFGRTSVEQWRPLCREVQCLHHNESAEKIDPEKTLDCLANFL